MDGARASVRHGMAELPVADLNCGLLNSAEVVLRSPSLCLWKSDMNTLQ